MPCVPSSRANHTLLRSCCVQTGCGCENKSSFSSSKYYSCKDTVIDQPSRQVTVCDLLAQIHAKTFTSSEFYVAFAAVLNKICGPINVQIDLIKTNVPFAIIPGATIVNGVITSFPETPLVPDIWLFQVNGQDGCTRTPLIVGVLGVIIV